MLVVLGALGIMMGSAAPVDAQEGPQGVTFGQRFRSVSFRTPIGNCNDIRYDPDTYVDVPFGQQRRPHQVTFTCGNGSKTFVGELFTLAGLGFDGWAFAEYQLDVRVDTASGSTSCGRVTAWSWLNRSITESFPFRWSQAAATSANGSVGDGFVRLNCGSHGRINVFLRVEEGIGTF